MPCCGKVAQLCEVSSGLGHGLKIVVGGVNLSTKILSYRGSDNMKSLVLRNAAAVQSM